MSTCDPPLPARLLALLALCLWAAMVGCQTVDLYTPSLQPPLPPALEPPSELSKVSLPTYRIQPPDVLQIDVVKLVPRPPYRIETYDVLRIRVVGTPIEMPIDDYFLVEGEGIVTLGPGYPTVHVVGMTIDEATAEITRQLDRLLQQPFVTVQLARSTGTQQLTGMYVVQPDGIVNLHRCGAVHMAGLTVTEARLAVEKQIAQYFDSPQVSVSVIGYNSMTYHLVVAGAQNGEFVHHFPLRGNETVLDAVSEIQGLSRVSSKTLWVARPAPDGLGAEQILPVDWVAITRGATETNYQLLPGDRIYIVDDRLIVINGYVTRVTAPIERLLNIASLGTTMVRDSEMMGRAYNAHR